MIFNSYQFLCVFLPASLAGTFLLARVSARAAQIWLIAASLLFYASWNVNYLPLLLGSIVFNYVIAVCMTRFGNGWLLPFAVAFDLGLLGYYKYTGFFLQTLHQTTGVDYTWQTLALPLGISFYTFQQLTLLADISSGRIKEFRFMDFLLFVTFFPHLIAGPIVHHREMMPQFQNADYRPRWENLAIGCILLVVGLFKKAILADGIAIHIAPIFTDAGDGKSISFLYAWVAAVGFTLQMYFDFSGYSDMALGSARMIGIKLPMNFNSPLKALSIVDYWSRWHITLTRFLTAYVYNPIALRAARRRAAAGKKSPSGSRMTTSAFLEVVAVPTMVTMFLSGLWHGAGHQFLLFGLLHGAALVINHAWRLLRPRIWPDTVHYHHKTWPLSWALTFSVVVVALTFFHAVSVQAGGNIVMALIGLHGFGETGNELAVAYGWIAALMIVALALPNVLEVLRAWQPAITMPPSTTSGRLDPPRGISKRLTFSLSPVWAVATAVLLTTSLLGLNRVSEFLYWRF